MNRKSVFVCILCVFVQIIPSLSVGFSAPHMRKKKTGWFQQAYVKAGNADTYDQFGYAVSLSGDTFAAGASLEDSNTTAITNGTGSSSDNSATDAGAVYVYKRTTGLWAQEAYIKPVNSNASDWFGTSLSLSGDTLVVGANAEASNQTTITNGATASTDNSVFATGAAYVYVRSGSIWTQQAYIKAPNANGGDYFGTVVAIDGDTIAVSAPKESSNQTTITNGTTGSADNSLSAAGAVYIFKRTGTTWAQQAYIKPPNPDSNDEFGSALSLNGDTLVVGVKNESSNQKTITNGTTASADNSVRASGAVYVYKRTGTTWAQEAYIKAANGDADDSFGTSVSINGDTLAVGAYNESSNQKTITNGTGTSSDNSFGSSGAVYIYKRSGSAWTQEAYIKASNSFNSLNLGTAVSVYGDTLLATGLGESSAFKGIRNGPTAETDTASLFSGAAYIFKRTGNSWAQSAYIKASNNDAWDLFGMFASLGDKTAVVATPIEASNQRTITNGSTSSADNTSANSGAVYIFQLQ